MSDETFHRYLVAASTSGGKFWEVLVDGTALNIRFGKVGQEKAWKTTTYASHELAIKEATKMMNAKIKKGYEEANEVPEAGEAPVMKAPPGLEELFGEIRSVLEGKVNAAAAKQLKKLYEACWKQDATRTAEELDAYLHDRLESWPYEYFSLKVKQRGLLDTWPKEAEPLRTPATLKNAPFTKFSREFKHLFDGNYQPFDDAEITPYLERHWVGRPIDFARLVTSPIAQRLESLYFDFDQISEAQSYSNLIYHSDIQTFLFNLPKLRHLLITDSFQTRGFGPSFRDERVQCRLKTFGSWESGFNQGDLIAMSESENLSELTTLRAGFSGYGGRRAAWVKEEIEALASSKFITQLTRFDLSTDQYNDTSLAELLVTSKNFSHLKDLYLDVPRVSPEFLEVLCQKDPPNGIKLDSMGGRFMSDNLLDPLDRLEQVPWKTFLVQSANTQLEEIGKRQKFRVKVEKPSYMKTL